MDRRDENLTDEEFLGFLDSSDDMEVLDEKEFQS